MDAAGSTRKTDGWLTSTPPAALVLGDLVLRTSNLVGEANDVPPEASDGLRAADGLPSPFEEGLAEAGMTTTMSSRSARRRSTGEGSRPGGTEPRRGIGLGHDRGRGPGTGA